MRAKKRIPSVDEFKKPVVVGSRTQSRIAAILDGRLDQLCKEFGIDSADPIKYRELCLALLADVIGVKGFQVVQTKPRGRGATPFWTVQKHFALVEFVDELLKAGATRAQAFGQARDTFAPKLTDDTVKVDYYVAKRLFATMPRVATMMKLIINAPHAARNFQHFIASPTSLKTSMR